MIDHKTRKHHFGGPAVFAAMSKLPMKSSGRNLVKIFLVCDGMVFDYPSQ